MKDYQKMWESLKVKIEADLRFHESGIMQSMAESFEGENKCKEILRYMESLEEMIPEVKKSEVVFSIQEEDDIFVCIKASELSLDDEFMQHRPKNVREQRFKDSLEAVICKGIADFWRPRMDPSFDKMGNIYFKAGEKPAVGKSYNWWRDNAKKFNPKRESRLGTKSQYIAFLGVLIKTLVAEGWDIDKAWNAVCNDSKKLGHYWNSVEAKHELELTGSRAIAGFYDIANTPKILAEDEEVKQDYDFLLAGGNYRDYSDNVPLAFVGLSYRCVDSCYDSVGWIVLS